MTFDEILDRSTAIMDLTAEMGLLVIRQLLWHYFIGFTMLSCLVTIGFAYYNGIAISGDRFSVVYVIIPFETFVVCSIAQFAVWLRFNNIRHSLNNKLNKLQTELSYVQK